jgi:hypothetical protein
VTKRKTPKVKAIVKVKERKREREREIKRMCVKSYGETNREKTRGERKSNR